MATIASMFINLLVGTSELRPGFEKANLYAQKFAGDFAKKMIGVGAAIGGVSKATTMIRDGLRASILDGEDFGQTMMKAAEGTATSIPILGAVGESIGLLAAKTLGWTDSLREANAELARLNKENLGRDIGTSTLKKSEGALGFTRSLAGLSGPEAAMAQQLEAVRQSFRGIFDQLKANNAPGIAFEQLRASIDNAQEAARQGSIQDLLRTMDDSISTWGMSATEIARWRLEMSGASEAQLKFFDDMAGNLAGLERMKDAREANKRAVESMMDEGKRLGEALRTPIEIFNDSIDRFNSLLGAGAISLDVYERAVRDAEKALESTIDTESKLGSGGLGQFTEAIQTAVGSIQVAGAYRGAAAMREPPTKELQKEEVAVAKKAEATLREIARNTRPSSNGDVPFG